MLLSPAEVHAEQLVVTVIVRLNLAIEVTGGLMIGRGIVPGGLRFVGTSFPPGIGDLDDVRPTLARFLACAAIGPATVSHDRID